MHLRYHWQESLAAAILEFDPQQLPAKLQDAEEAISKRLQDLLPAKDRRDELRALTDGLNLIRDIKKRQSASGDS